MKEIKFEGKPVINGCAVVALLLNSDGYRKKGGQCFNADDVVNSNSHGELFGIHLAISVAEELINKHPEDLSIELQQAIKQTIETGVVPEADKEGRWATGMGRACAQQLWSGVP